jgi:hypothetical protein
MREVDEGVFLCDCKSMTDCIECSPELYAPLCQQCEEMGDYAMGVEQVEGPLGRQWACARHYNEAGEAGATMWSTEDVGAGERMSAAYDLDRGQK